MKKAAAAAVLVVLLACSACSSGGSAKGSEDARAACAVLQGLPRPLPEVPTDSADRAGQAAADSVMNRLGAARELADAAALADSAHQALADAAEKAQAAPVRTFSYRSADPYITEALKHC
ncbi:hypothetical protein OH807_32130 [Kitasatospora sp. NBC_01560]|uniref:hypothetical protein n=1 Tax=Kitasatospora sp. NBC_01560 TaxID=2975965 RepID=UPI00386C71DC